MQKRVAKTLIKPVENEDFGAPFSEMALKIIKKHYLEKVFATRFQNVGKPYKTNETLFLKSQNRVAETLIKPVEIDDFEQEVKNEIKLSKSNSVSAFWNMATQCRKTL